VGFDASANYKSPFSKLRSLWRPIPHEYGHAADLFGAVHTGSQDRKAVSDQDIVKAIQDLSLAVWAIAHQSGHGGPLLNKSIRQDCPYCARLDAEFTTKSDQPK
jgi:hypothetical protein